MTKREDLAVVAAQRLFPPGAEVAGCVIGEAPPPYPIEACAVAAAVPARKAEFAAGRAAARRALVALGLPETAIPSQGNRAPLWPNGIVGSITHTDGIALAVLAPARQALSLGLDAEPDAPFPQDLVETVTRPEERKWASSQNDPLRAIRLIFAAKEAAYKCQFPRSQAILSFDAMRISVIDKKGGLSAEFMIDVPPFQKGSQLAGRFAFAAGLCMTGFTLSGPGIGRGGNG